MTRIQVRRDTSANWTKNNPVLASGEPAYETDTGKFKIGDGSKNYTALPYQGGGGGTDTPIATTQVAGKVKPDGTTITITEDGTISAANGGGLTPDENDRVTLEGINLKQHNLSNPSGSIYASGGNIQIRNRDNAGMFLDSYGGLYKINPQGIQSELIDNSMNPAFTTKVNFFNNDQIIHSNHGLKFGLNSSEPRGSITAIYGNMRLNPDKIDSPNAELKIGTSTLTYTDRDGNTHNLLESGGSTPANMVTTDTNQVITSEKGFTSAIKIMGSTTDNYYGQIIRPDGSTVRIQAQYGNPAGLNIGVSSLTYTDASGIDHNLLSSGGATINDSAASNTSTYSSSKIEKLTNITSSDASISITKSDTGVDIVINKNEWVYVNKQLLNNVNRTNENITVDLSDSLPNDGATYEVLFSSMAQPTVEKNKFCAVIAASTEISPGMRVAQGRVAAAGVDAAAYGTFLLPITSSRSMLLGGSSSSNNGGVMSLWMHAYKKVG